MDISDIRAQFPLICNQNTAYLDNAATTQKPQCVIDALVRFYSEFNANPMRGIYDLSQAATDAYESAREKTAAFINAKEASEIVFTRNATESLNLTAGIMAQEIKEGDEILVGVSEHHSNFLPWKRLAQKTGAIVKYLDCTLTGEYTIGSLEDALSENTKIFAIASISNVLGRLNPIKDFARICHKNNTLICVDASQSVAHRVTDVTDDDVDFLAFSGHKMYAPMGIGVLYAKKKLLCELPPFLEGGEMIDFVSKDKTLYSEVPHKFEAGTVSAADAYALGEAIDFIKRTGFDEIEKRESELIKRAFEKMRGMDEIEIVGAQNAADHKGIITFTLKDIHPHDIAAIFADEGICIRAGHHCAQPLHIHLKIPSTVRVSPAFYNTEEEIDRFINVLSSIRSRMGY